MHLQQSWILTLLLLTAGCKYSYIIVIITTINIIVTQQGLPVNLQKSTYISCYLIENIDISVANFKKYENCHLLALAHWNIWNDFQTRILICIQYFFKVTMTVDGTYNEKWTTSGTFSMLSSNKVFIGGSNQPYKLPGANSKANFVGCMKKVGIFLDFVSFLPTMREKKSLWWTLKIRPWQITQTEIAFKAFFLFKI